MRKRKDSHDGSPVGDTNILFVPDSSADPSASGVDALMGMIGEADADLLTVVDTAEEAIEAVRSGIRRLAAEKKAETPE